MMNPPKLGWEKISREKVKNQQNKKKRDNDKSEQGFFFIFATLNIFHPLRKIFILQLPQKQSLLAFAF